jgi:retron-type reverse transcriptase
MQLDLFDSWPEQPTERIIEEIVRQSNLLKAFERVKRNGGAPGVDGVTIANLSANLPVALERVRKELVSGTYQPSPVLTLKHRGRVLLEVFGQ